MPCENPRDADHCVLTCATAANAECVRFGPSGLNWPGVEVVFDGTVVELKESGEMQVAQMQVHRVFKGHLPPRIEVYHRPDIEASGIEAGQRYVLPLLRMNPSGTGIVRFGRFWNPRTIPRSCGERRGAAAWRATP